MINGELIVDNFAGGGGASTGIEIATGKSVDIAINHDIEAIRMHKANHPHTKHYCENVWEVDPVKACEGHPVGLAWFSPDCKHFSKAKGGKPVEKNIRGLAWVVLKWAALVRPRVIMLENVEEFQTWGPCVPIRDKKTGRVIVNTTEKHEKNRMDEPLKVITSKHGFGIVEPKLTPYMGTNTTNHSGGDCGNSIHTITTGNQQCLISPTIIQYHSETSAKEVRGQDIEEPIMTLDSSNRYGLVTSFLHKYYDGGYKGAGDTVKNPLPTVTAWDHNSLVTANLIQMNNHCDGRDIKEPLPTITAGDGHFGEVRAFLIKYYGEGTGQDIKNPLDTITSRDRFGLVTIAGVDYQIVDIGLRMLEPKELYGCQGFPDDYIIDHDFEGHKYPRSEQVRRCGNSVCPPLPAAMVRSNLPELCVAERMPNITKDRVETEENGQLAFA